MARGNSIPSCHPTTPVDVVDRRDPRFTDVPLLRRMWARSFAARYDAEVERGVAVEAGTPLAAHYARLVSPEEREDMADALTLLLRDAALAPGEQTRQMRIPTCAEAIRRSSTVIEDVRTRLLAPQPVRTRGMARLRILLADGRGPVYRPGPGTLTAAMRGVLAAL